MPRTARPTWGGICYHVINRGNGHATVFHDDSDYRSFIALMQRCQARLPLDLFAACLMPNHFHLTLRPRADGALSTWMHWLLTAHVRKHHCRYGTDGRLWQGRFKAFPIQDDSHLLTVMRYVERNALRANIVKVAQTWPWGSLQWRMHDVAPLQLATPPVDLPSNWPDYVNRAEFPHELKALRLHTNKETPFGSPHWVRHIMQRTD